MLTENRPSIAKIIRRTAAVAALEVALLVGGATLKANADQPTTQPEPTATPVTTITPAENQQSNDEALTLAIGGIGAAVIVSLIGALALTSHDYRHPGY